MHRDIFPPALPPTIDPFLGSIPSSIKTRPSSPSLLTLALPPFDQLDRYWQDYFHNVDNAIEENFWGNLSTLKKSEDYGDPYIAQLQKMGLSLIRDQERPLSFYRAISWVMDQIDALIQSNIVQREEVILPAKAFLTKDPLSGERYHFIPLGQPAPKYSEPLNLLPPALFVTMIAEGYFPIGEPIREHTNQTLAEHDLAHMGGFISNPRFMQAVRAAFCQIRVKMEQNPRVKKALEHFNSLYSLRLYYMIEISTEIAAEGRLELQRLLEIPLDTPISLVKERTQTHLRRKNPIELSKYLAKLYENFHRLVNPLGGESRDILNRRRKFRRGNTLGSFYDGIPKLSSKFDHNSIFALFLNAKAALENKRSNHADYLRAIDEIHTPLIGALIGMSQLNIEDWVLQSVEELPDPDSKLYRYLRDSGFWSSDDILLLCYTDTQYDRILN